MPAVFYPNVACLQMATELKAVLAASKMRLFQSTFVPSVSSTKADCEAAECDFTGYPAGGIAITAWSAAILDPAGGAGIESGLVQFVWATGSPDVGNLVGGWFLEDSTGKLRAIGVFDVPVPMQAAGQGIPLSVKLISSTGQGV